MIELWQAEWCPHSHRVRQRLTEMGVPFVAHQVPADSERRAALRSRLGTDEIPALLLDDGTVLCGSGAEVVAALEKRFVDADDADRHRAKAAEFAAALAD